MVSHVAAPQRLTAKTKTLGSSIVQAAICVPFIVILVIICLEFSYISISQVVLASQIQHAITACSLSDASSSPNPARYLHNAICSYSSIIKEDKLTVRNVNFTKLSNSDEQNVYGKKVGESETNFGAGNIENQQHTISLSLDVNYQLESVLDVSQHFGSSLTKHIVTKQNVSSEFELS